MKLSPLDIYNKEFKKATFGYNTNQVEAFLDEVGMAYEKLLKEVTVLQDENDRLNKRLESHQELDIRLEKMLSTVQDSANEYTRQARKEAAALIDEAELKAAEIRREAQQELEQEYRRLQELKESKNLFMIRFRTLLESHLQMLGEAEQERVRDKEKRENLNYQRDEIEEDYNQYYSMEEDVAASSEEESELDE